MLAVCTSFIQLSVSLLLFFAVLCSLFHQCPLHHSMCLFHCDTHTEWRSENNVSRFEDNMIRFCIKAFQQVLIHLNSLLVKTV